MRQRKSNNAKQNRLHEILKNKNQTQLNYLNKLNWN